MDFASALYARLKGLLPWEITSPDGSRWTLAGINERFRPCRYEAGQFFKIHRDGAYHRSHTVQSKITLMVYLNGAEDFLGGQTRFS